MRGRLFTVVVLFTAASAYGQAATPDPLSPGVSQADAYIKIIGAVVTAIAALLGMPALLLASRKSRAEITKLELEAAALRAEQAGLPNQSKDQAGNIRIHIESSPNASIRILADPRFLAPLLVLLDFIFASVVLTLAGYLLSIFGFGPLRNLALAALAGVLLLPIAREVIRVRSILHPARTPEEVRAAQRQAWVAGIAVYFLCVLVLLLVGGALLFQEDLTGLGRYVAWTLLGVAVLMVALVPFARNRFDRFLNKVRDLDAG